MITAKMIADSYYDFEPEDVNKENLSIAEMSGKKLDWFRKVCAAVLQPNKEKEINKEQNEKLREVIKENYEIILKEFSK